MGKNNIIIEIQLGGDYAILMGGWLPLNPWNSLESCIVYVMNDQTTNQEQWQEFQDGAKT